MWVFKRPIGPSLRSWRFFLSEPVRERRSCEGIEAGFLISPAPIPWRLRRSLAWLLGQKKTPTKQATSGLSTFSNKGYEMAPAVDGPFLCRFICSYYVKTYFPIGCFGDVIDN